MSQLSLKVNQLSFNIWNSTIHVKGFLPACRPHLQSQTLLWSWTSPSWSHCVIPSWGPHWKEGLFRVHRSSWTENLDFLERWERCSFEAVVENRKEYPQTALKFWIIMCSAPDSCVGSRWGPGPLQRSWSWDLSLLYIILASTDHCSLSKELENLIQIVVCGCSILEQTAIVAKIKKKKSLALISFPW